MNNIDKQVQDTKILQQVRSIQRNAFVEKFPGQIEHLLRLITERLHLGLDKRDGCDPSDPDTWKLSSQEIASLAEAMYHIHLIREDLKNDRS